MLFNNTFVYLIFWAYPGIALPDTFCVAWAHLANELSIEVMGVTFRKEYLVAVLIHYKVFNIQKMATLKMVAI